MVHYKCPRCGYRFITKVILETFVTKKSQDYL